MKKNFRVLVNYGVFDYETLEQAKEKFEKAKNAKCGVQGLARQEKLVVFLIDKQQNKMLDEYEREL